jgi:DNA-binding NarL/FixJ family response regulator
MRKATSTAAILVIEDDPQLRHNIALILTREGYEVQLAEDGGAALSLLGKWRPDLILCDILMPGMDGYAVCEELRKLPQGADIPFIYVSALSEYPQIRKGMVLGADDYLTKPFSSKDLLAAVSSRLMRFTLFRDSSPLKPLSEEELAKLNQLTLREREILDLIGQGCKTKEIAKQLFISPKTVEVHSSRLKKKLSAVNAVMLAHWATRLKLSSRK